MPRSEGKLRMILERGAARSAIVVALLSSFSAAIGQELSKPSEKSVRESFSLRDIYVPVDRLEDFARGYFPHDKAEFEKLIERSASTEGDRAPPARVTEALYLARLEGDHLVDGRLRWRTIVLDRPVLLDLATCRLPLANLAWSGDRPEPARIETSADGAVSLSIARTGVLEGSWSLAASANLPGASGFQWRPIAAASSSLLIDAPRDRRLAASLLGEHPAYVEKLADAGKRDPTLLDLFGDAPPPADHERWLVVPAGDGSADFAAVSATAAAPAPVVFVDEQTDYRLGKHALDISATLTLDIRRAPLGALRVELPSEAIVSSVRLGDAVLPHHVEAAAPEAFSGETPTSETLSKKQLLVVPLQKPLSGRQLIQINALAPLAIDRPWRLPRFEVAQAFFQDGSVRLVSHPELSIDRLELVHARQTRFTRASASDPNEIREARLFRADAAIETIVRRRPAQLRIESGLWVSFEAARTTAVLTVDVAASAGEVHSLTAISAADWIIDLIETEPADALEPIGLETLTDGRQRIDIRLRTPITAGRPLRLKIRGRAAPLPLASGAGEANRWRFIEFPDVAEQSRIAALSTGLGRLAPAGDAQLARFDGGRLAIRERDLLPQATSADLVFRDDEAAAALVVQVEPERPAFDAALRGAAFVSKSQVRERWRFLCRPAGAPIERLLVQFSLASPAPLEWRLAEESDGGFVARRLTPDEQAAANLSGGETWRIEFRRPRRAAFELVADRVAPWRQRHALALAWLPEAETQTANVALLGFGETNYLVEGERASPIDAAALTTSSAHSASEPSLGEATFVDDPSTKGYSLRAAYRYEAGQAASIAVTASERPASELVWCWDFQLESKLAGAGRDRHRATWRLESAGASSFHCRLPIDATVERLWIDGREASPREDMALSAAAAPRDKRARLSIPLPAGQRHPCVAIEFSTAGRELPWLGTVEPPEVDAPCDVFAGRWLLSLPADWKRSQEQADEAASGDWSWIAKRLAGPLWRTKEGRDAPSPLNWGAQRLASERSIDIDVASERTNEQNANRASDSWEAVIWTSPPMSSQDEGKGANWRTYTVELHSLRPDDQAVKSESASTPPSTFARIYKPQIASAAAAGVLLAILALCLGIGRRRWRALAPLAGAAAAMALLAPADWAPVATGAWQAVVLAAIASLALPRRGARGIEPAAEPSSANSRRLMLSHGARTASALVGAAVAFGGLAALHAAESPPPAKSDSKDEGAAIGGGSASDAAGAANGKSTDAPTVYRVIHPIDEQLRPVGEYVYLPQPLYDALRLRASEGEVRRGWRLTAASYLATLGRRDSESPWRIAGLTAKYSVEATGENTRLVLPFDRRDVYLPADGAKLDGRAAAFVWDSSGKGLGVSLGAGKHELELSLLPTPSASAGAPATEENSEPARDERASERVFTFDVLPHPSARFTVRGPAGAPSPRFIGALGAEKTIAEGEWRADFGPATRIGLRWGQSDSDRRAQGQRIDQASWMHIRPGGVSLTVRLSPSRVDGALASWSPGEELVLRGDPSLVLVASNGGGRSDDSLATLVAPGEWRVAAPASGDGKEAIELEFLGDASFQSNFASPKLSLEATRVGRRWLAVSCADSLLLEDGLAAPANGASAPGAQRAPVADFLSVWGETRRPSASPAAAYRQSASGGESPAWAGAVRERGVKLAAREQLDIGVGRRSASLRYEALLETNSGEVFQLRLLAPAEFVVASASLVAEDEERVVRFSQTKMAREGQDASEISVFLNGAATGPARLVIVGRLPLALGESDAAVDWKTPIVSLSAAERLSWKARVYRRPDVALEAVEEIAATNAVGAQEESDWRPEWGRFVASFETPAPSSRVFKARANRPAISCLSLTEIERRDGAWAANVDCRWTVSDGVADQFRLELPTDFEAAIEADGAAATFESTGDPKRRRLILRPKRAVAGALRILLRGPLAASGEVSVPEVAPLDAASVGGFVALPMLVESRQVAWSTRGLQPTSPPAPFEQSRANGGANGDRQFFRVIDRFRASIAETAPARGEPQIRLADYRLAFRADGRCHGVADFDLESAGLEEITLRLPSGLRLVAVTVAELPAQRQRIAAEDDSEAWRLKLGPAEHPQRIEVVFDGRLSSPASADGTSTPVEWKALVPELAGLPIDRTLWTLRGDQAIVRFGGWADDEQVSPARQELVRLRVLHEFLKSPAGAVSGGDVSSRAPGAAAQGPSDDSRHWRNPWLVRFARSQAKIARFVEAVSTSSPQVDSRPPPAFDPAAEAQSLAREIADAPREPAAYEGNVAAAAALWDGGQSPAEHLSHYSFPGAGPRVTLAVAAPQAARTLAAPATRKIAAACLAMALGLLVSRLLALGGFATWAARWPQFLLAAAGAIWWLWLSPASLGLAIMAVAAASAIWPSWRGLRERASRPAAVPRSSSR